jgi:prolyl 4-hydroxylase
MLLVETPDVLSAVKCERLINEFGGNIKPSMVGLPGRRYVSRLRNSYGAPVAPLPEWASEVPERVAAIAGMPNTHNERWQIVRYRAGEEFRPHMDFLQNPAPNGQRQYTALLYLRAPEQGGETVFIELGRRIEPVRGKLLVWQNATDQGRLIKTSLHASRPVTSGEKWVLVTWVRSRPYDYAADTWVDRQSKK